MFYCITAHATVNGISDVNYRMLCFIVLQFMPLSMGLVMWNVVFYCITAHATVSGISDVDYRMLCFIV